MFCTTVWKSKPCDSSILNTKQSSEGRDAFSPTLSVFLFHINTHPRQHLHRRASTQSKEEIYVHPLHSHKHGDYMTACIHRVQHSFITKEPNAKHSTFMPHKNQSVLLKFLINAASYLQLTYISDLSFKVLSYRFKVKNQQGNMQYRWFPDRALELRIHLFKETTGTVCSVL